MIRLVVSVEICCDDRSAELECEVAWFRSLMTILFAALLNVWVLNKRNFVVEICCDDRSAELECEVVWFRSLMTILFAALLNVWVLNKRNVVHGRLSEHFLAYRK